MISNSEYEVLRSLLKSHSIDLSKNITAINKLKDDKLIKLHSVMYKNIDNELDFGYDGFEVTQEGVRAIEEYEIFINAEQRENDTLRVAKESNVLSSESNQIAKAANKKSTTANIISCIAIAISLLSILASILIAKYL